MHVRLGQIAWELDLIAHDKACREDSTDARTRPAERNAAMAHDRAEEIQFSRRPGIFARLAARLSFTSGQR
jgi:hypothetical protein